jgi:hypothetical protein
MASSGLPWRASSPAWRSWSLWLLVTGHGLDLGDIRIVGIDAAQRSSASLGLFVDCRSACSPWPGRPELQYFGIGEKNLLPDLDGHVGPAARLQVHELSPQDRRAWPSEGLARRTYFERDPAGSANSRQPATIASCFLKPRSQPHQRSILRSVPRRAKPKSTIEKAGCKQGEILIVIRQVLSIQSRSWIPLRGSCESSASRFP